jgi:hypothetical protein
MISRREFSYATSLGLFSEIAFAQHAAVQGDVPPGTLWLNPRESGRTSVAVEGSAGTWRCGSGALQPSSLSLISRRSCFGNPNNPTSSITPGTQVRWLAEHLPPNTVLLIDEAYIQFTDPAEGISGIDLVREGKNIIVTRTFSNSTAWPGEFRPDTSRSRCPRHNSAVSGRGRRNRTPLRGCARLAACRCPARRPTWRIQERVQEGGCVARTALIQGGARSSDPTWSRAAPESGRPLAPRQRRGPPPSS